MHGSPVEARKSFGQYSFAFYAELIHVARTNQRYKTACGAAFEQHITAAYDQVTTGDNALDRFGRERRIHLLRSRPLEPRRSALVFAALLPAPLPLARRL